MRSRRAPGWAGHGDLTASVALTLFPAQIIWPELADLRLGGIVGQMIVAGLTAWVPPWGGLAATSLISAGATALAISRMVMEGIFLT